MSNNMKLIREYISILLESSRARRLAALAARRSKRKNPSASSLESDQVLYDSDNYSIGAIRRKDIVGYSERTGNPRYRRESGGIQYFIVLYRNDSLRITPGMSDGLIRIQEDYSEESKDFISLEDLYGTLNSATLKRAIKENYDNAIVSEKIRELKRYMIKNNILGNYKKSGIEVLLDSVGNYNQIQNKISFFSEILFGKGIVHGAQRQADARKAGFSGLKDITGALPTEVYVDDMNRKLRKRIHDLKLEIYKQIDNSGYVNIISNYFLDGNKDNYLEDIDSMTLEDFKSCLVNFFNENKEYIEKAEVNKTYTPLEKASLAALYLISKPHFRSASKEDGPTPGKYFL